tara:strand:+ start:865 stop:1761 length:897 start_codon:yes stop_codon:yes gene_type:complete
MKSYCTISDINFLPYGLALHESLKEHSPEFRLYYLCTDAESYHSLNRLAISEIIPVSLDELKKQDKLLAAAENLNPSYEAANVAARTGNDAKKVQFFWCLTPYFTWHTLNRPDVDEVLYIDSDIFFFGPVEQVYQETKANSIGIVRHRINYNPAVGEYNVGIVYFRKNLKGYQCVDWWKNCLLNPNNEHYRTHGMCGDQKYLELFQPLFKDVRVIDDIGHLAPWNYMNHSYTDDSVIWQGKEQELIYIHFSNFSPNYKEGTYQMAPRHGITETTVSPFVREKYDKYFNTVRQMKELIS